MANNDPSNAVNRKHMAIGSSPAMVEVRQVSVTHGFMNPESLTPATLLVMESYIGTSKRSARIESATISIRFSNRSNHTGRDPLIRAIAPAKIPHIDRPHAGDSIATTEGLSGSVNELPSSLEETSQPPQPPKRLVGKLEGNISRLCSTAEWSVYENADEKSGVQIRLQTALLIERDSDDEQYQATVTIETSVATFALKSRQVFRGDPVIFDPARSKAGNIEAEIPAGNLESVDLSLLGSVTNLAEAQSRRNVTEILDNIASSYVQSGTQQKIESHYHEIWNARREGRGWVTVEEDAARIDGKTLPSVLTPRILRDSFSWMKQTQDERIPAQSHDMTHFDLILQKSDQTGLNTISKVRTLLDNESHTDMLVKFFKLPAECSYIRLHEGGACQFFPSITRPGKVTACIIQTPFYRTGFWSLILYSEIDQVDPHSLPRISGIIQADSTFNFKRHLDAIRGASSIYPTILPLELYKEHVESTAKQFEEMLRTLREVDAKLLEELKGTGKPDDARISYRLISKTLHECNMNLVELGRRRRFEDDFGETLKTHVNDEEHVMTQTISILAAMSKSREYDMQTLPSKVESQRNVLYGLIAQFDNNMQSRLAREALRDSKAMKTLSIITILFLPGAFVATLFSTNMFSFRGDYEEIWIYFVICVPLTAILMTAWILWLRSTPYGVDEERGTTSQIDEKPKSQKAD